MTTHRSFRRKSKPAKGRKAMPSAEQCAREWLTDAGTIKRCRGRAVQLGYCRRCWDLGASA